MAAAPSAVSFPPLSTTSGGQSKLRYYRGTDTHPQTLPTGQRHVRICRYDHSRVWVQEVPLVVAR
ncbi:hypothetical protein BDM02DRAFT_3119333 [Thelephora ganbajun]|uniref:Uncharacterized protein n=1 Tax=Thelephora ganbajun TaxID=370292 RepID=A0ACB6Z8G6_THEGA|nr:hypothetical protein BDM02DRAFT_3119333 [Thelephora ganbajun]